MDKENATRKVHGYCAMCVARCGTIATIENGRFVALEPDPAHPTGEALCAKGRAAPEIVYHPDRILYPMRRTRPKGDLDPGWEQIGWDQALDLIAAAMQRIAARHGPHAVATSTASPSTTAIADSFNWIRRLMTAFGTPNACNAIDICGWSRGYATRYTFGVGSVGSSGGAMADIAHSGCMILWGYNPSISRITHATAIIAARKRGMKLIVIDPRRAGLASKADVWLRVRPGTDGALALGLANLMIERNWYDVDFLRRWSNGPLLVRADTGRLLRERDISPSGRDDCYIAWDDVAGGPVGYDPATGSYEHGSDRVALKGRYVVATRDGEVTCDTSFQLYADLCSQHTPEVIEKTCWVPPADLEAAADMLWNARPVSYYAWSGHEQQSNTTQTARAISLLYAMTGCFDVKGGNVLFPSVPTAPITGEDLPGAQGLAPAVGLAERPLGVARWNFVAARDLYTAILEQKPYPVKAVIGFGANPLVAHADVLRGRAAFMALEFYAHADLFMNPTAELADIVLPSASPFECEALKVGFEISAEAQSRVQLRPALVPPPGEARSDTRIVFDLASRLGLGEYFWHGDIEAAWTHHLAPSGLTPQALRAAPGGIDVALDTRYEKHAEAGKDGVPRGFATPSRRAEFYSETFLKHHYAPLPAYVEPMISPVARPDLSARFPLILTSSKHTLFLNSQNRGVSGLRRRARDPEIEMHPDAARARGIGAKDWVNVETPEGKVRARARFDATLDPRVVSGQHGWWQASPALGAPGYDAFGPDGASFNLLIGGHAADPVSGSAPHRAYVCEVSLA